MKRGLDRFSAFPLAVLAPLVVGGCGEDPRPGPPRDGFRDAALVDASSLEADGGSLEDDAGPEVEPLPIPEDATPSFDCGAWRTVAGPRGVDVCEPWPDEGRASCPPGEVHWPGAPGCAPIGEGCGTELFPAEGSWPSERRPVHVDPAAEDGGDGSRERPWSRLDDALDLAGPTTAILLARGVHPLGRALPADTFLRGVCVAESILVASAPVPLAPTLTVDDGRVVLSNLTVRGRDDAAGVDVFGSETVLEVDGIEVTDVAGFGVRLATATLEGNDLVIRGTRERVGDVDGVGLILREGRTRLDGLAVEDTHAFGIQSDRSANHWERVVVAGVSPRANDGAFGRGVSLLGQGLGGSETTVADLVVEDGWDVGVDVETSVIEADGFIVRRIRSNDALPAQGVVVRSFGLADLGEGRVTEVAGVGMATYLGDVGGASFLLRSVLVDAIERAPCGEGPCAAGHGMVAQMTTRLAGSRVHVSGTSTCGLWVEENAQALLDSALVAGNPIGVCVRDPGYDPRELGDGVFFEDNGADIELSSAATPEPPSRVDR